MSRLPINFSGLFKPVVVNLATQQLVGDLVVPKRVATKASVTPTYQATNPDNLLTLPTYLSHLEDLATLRTQDNTQTLVENLCMNDPDMSAALNAYLTVSNCDYHFICMDELGNIDRECYPLLKNITDSLEFQSDYSIGYKFQRSLRSRFADQRLMVLVRGGVSGELIVDKTGVVSDNRDIDIGTIRWVEKQNGMPKPSQLVQGITGSGVQNTVPLDFANIGVVYHRRFFNTLYPKSMFTAAINTIAARQQVINDLYRIMQVTGYPRMTVKVLEKIVIENMPPEIRNNAQKRKEHLEAVLGDLSNKINSLRPDQAFVHVDSVEAEIINEKSAGMALDIRPIIEVLNAQNQAGLKSMATILGRGESGVNTASVEAVLFAMSASEINQCIEDYWSQQLTFLLRVATGRPVTCKLVFSEPELRSKTELEPQLALRRARLIEDLSLGIISDDEYALAMYGRIRLDTAPELSGTKFTIAQSPVDPTQVSSNNDAMGRTLTPNSSSKAARGKAVDKSKVKK